MPENVPCARLTRFSAVKIPSIRHEDVEILTKDKVKLRCYLIPQPSEVSMSYFSYEFPFKIGVYHIETSEGNGNLIPWKCHESWRQCYTSRRHF